jgi:hypothetical protein
VDFPEAARPLFFLDDFPETVGFFLVEVDFPLLFFPPMRPFSLRYQSECRAS